MHLLHSSFCLAEFFVDGHDDRDWLFRSRHFVQRAAVDAEPFPRFSMIWTPWSPTPAPVRMSLAWDPWLQGEHKHSNDRVAEDTGQC